MTKKEQNLKIKRPTKSRWSGKDEEELGLSYVIDGNA